MEAPINAPRRMCPKELNILGEVLNTLYNDFKFNHTFICSMYRKKLPLLRKFRTVYVMNDTLMYKLKSGKPSKGKYFVKSFLKNLVPPCFYHAQGKRMLKALEQRSDKEYILDRVNYYNRYDAPFTLPQETWHKRNGGIFHFLDRISAFKLSTFHSAYFFDFKDATRWFNDQCRVAYVPGDVYFTPEVPAFVKSRLLSNDNSNSVLLKLDKWRHFMFVNDTKPWSEKCDKAIFRGKIRWSRQRTQFLEMYFNHPMCDCGVVGNEDVNPEWKQPKKTIQEHLDYKFIMALEGNDVATNLKWVMSSNSLAVMPRPTCETWFMEGRLIPNVHYVEIKSDLSDLEERMNYYINHPDEAQIIIENAHQFVKQFVDDERENLIQFLVVQKYLKQSGQNNP